MTLSKLIRRVWRRSRPMKRGDVEHLSIAMMELVTEAISEGRRVEFRGFGAFSLRNRSARPARNPRTGEAIWLAARHAVHFKPGLALRTRVDAASKTDDEADHK